MTRRVLVTGANGFLGAHVLRALHRLPGVEPIAACRRAEALPSSFTGEVRVGDLRDAAYRDAVVQGVDAVCHCGTWGALWGHEEQEQAWFREPTEDLIERCIEHGVDRFLLASSVAIGRPTPGVEQPDHGPTATTGFWPHLDHLVALDTRMRSEAHRGTSMVTMRLGHFIGAGNRLGLVPALVPRLRTYMVPWLDGGRARVPLVSGEDMGRAFALAATAPGLTGYESFHVTGSEAPTMREVFGHLSALTGAPLPLYSVPTFVGHAFA